MKNFCGRFGDFGTISNGIEMENELIKIEKLQTHAQWTMWKFQIKIILKSREVYEVVSGEDPKPDNTEGADYAARLAAWKKSDIKAQRVIVTTISQRVMVHIVNCMTSCEMWNRLHSVFERKTETGILYLQQRYYSYTRDPQDDMASYISKLEEIVLQLADLGLEIPEQMVISKVILSLPSEYRHFSSAWESAAKTDRTLDNLRTRLMTEESRIQSEGKSEQVEAFVARKNFPKKKVNTKNDGQQSKQPGKGGKEAKPKPRGKCFGCGEAGHFRRDCQKKKSVAKNEEGASTSASSGAFMCQTTTQIDDRDVWVLDSGASDHMCNRREWFQNYTDASTSVTIGNGTKIVARGKGDIDILAYDGNDWIQKQILDVLYVPEIHMNLFSSGRVMDRGYEQRSNNERCEFLEGENVVAVGVRRGGLYRMLFKIVESTEINVTMANVVIRKISLREWHERMGHQNVAQVKKFLRINEIDFVDEDFACEACVYGKHHRGSFRTREERSVTCGAIIHTDVCGPMQETSLGGSRYFLLLKDDYSHFRVVYFMRQKSEVAGHIKNFVRQTQKVHGHGIGIVRSDNGTEYVNDELRAFFDELGIHHQRTVAYTPEQNGGAEREMRTIVESARTMIHSKQMDLKFWAEAVNAAVHVLNRTGTSTVQDTSPFELWFGKRPKIDHFRVFGSSVFVHIPKERRRKLDPKANKCIFVGYDNHAKAYRVWNPKSGKIEVVRDVIFLLEDSMATLSVDDAGKIVDGEVNEASAKSNDGNADPDGDNDNNEPDADVTPEQQVGRGAWCDLDQRNVVKRRLRNREDISAARRLTYLASANHIAMLAVREEPNTYEQAIQSDDHEQWEKAMDEEYDSLIQNCTWILVKPPNGQKVIDNRWVFKLKQNADGGIDRFKARLVVRGFTQEYGIDYHETFSPVVKFTSIRAILALAASKRMSLKQFDVKTAFLNGDLEEVVYMCQPIGYDDESGRVCKLSKSLYGLKQASRCWNKKFTSFMREFDFKASESDPCVFVYTGANGMMVLAIYVDDGLIAAENEEAIGPVIEYLRREFEIKFFDAKYFLGLEIDIRPGGSVHVSQGAYARKVLDRFHMMNCNPVSTPCDNAQNLGDFVADGKLDFPYREAVGSLMYLAVATRPDISFAVGNVSRYLEKPAEAHENAVKRILKYIRGTIDMGICFESENDLVFRGYSDADYAGDVETRRSTSGYVFMFGNGIISWCSERQKSVALSTTESEYIAASHAVKELVWLKRLLSELLLVEMDAPIFFMDNQSAIRLVKNPEFHKRTKHIDVRFHFIREKFEDGTFDLEYVPSNEMVADILTKALPKDRHRYLCMLMGILPRN